MVCLTKTERTWLSHLENDRVFLSLLLKVLLLWELRLFVPRLWVLDELIDYLLATSFRGFESFNLFCSKLLPLIIVNNVAIVFFRFFNCSSIFHLHILFSINSSEERLREYWLRIGHFCHISCLTILHSKDCAPFASNHLWHVNIALCMMYLLLCRLEDFLVASIINHDEKLAYSQTVWTRLLFILFAFFFFQVWLYRHFDVIIHLVDWLIAVYCGD